MSPPLIPPLLYLLLHLFYDRNVAPPSRLLLLSPLLLHPFSSHFSLAPLLPTLSLSLSSLSHACKLSFSSASSLFHFYMHVCAYVRWRKLFFSPPSSSFFSSPSFSHLLHSSHCSLSFFVSRPHLTRWFCVAVENTIPRVKIIFKLINLKIESWIDSYNIE